MGRRQVVLAAVTGMQCVFSAAAPSPAGCKTALAAPCNAQTTAVPCTVQLLLELAFFKESLEAFLQPPVSGMFATAEDMLAAKFAGGLPAGGPAGAEALAEWVDPQVSTRCISIGWVVISEATSVQSVQQDALFCTKPQTHQHGCHLIHPLKAYTLMRVARC